MSEQIQRKLDGDEAKRKEEAEEAQKQENDEGEDDEEEEEEEKKDEDNDGHYDDIKISRHKGSNQVVIETSLGEMTELDSLCPKCQQNGTTRLMITDVPFFKKIIVSSFSCPHCHEQNVDTTFGGEFGPKKTRHHLKVKCKEDMQRQLVKSEFAVLKIPELQLEMPPETQRGSLNTVEGVIMQTIEGLELNQPVRRVMQPEFAVKIDQFCDTLREYTSGEKPFSIIIDDPAGNSYIEPRYDYYHPTTDPQLSLYAYTRNSDDRQTLGLPPDPEADEVAQKEKETGGTEIPMSTFLQASKAVTTIAAAQQQQVNSVGGGASSATSATGSPPSGSWKANKKVHDLYNTLRTAKEEDEIDRAELPEIYEFRNACPACLKESLVRMHPTNIPHFRDIIIMAFSCDFCGYKSTEVQGSGHIEDKGKKITLKVEDESDLKRDVLKSSTSTMICPEVELELTPGTLGGFFTTVEGLLTQVHDRLRGTSTMSDFNQADFEALASHGDGEKSKERIQGAGEKKEKMQGAMDKFLDRLKEACDGKILPLTIIIDDPTGNVYIQNPRAHLPPPANEDPRLEVELYTRTEEQDEDLGIHHDPESTMDTMNTKKDSSS